MPATAVSRNVGDSLSRWPESPTEIQLRVRQPARGLCHDAEVGRCVGVDGRVKPFSPVHTSEQPVTGLHDNGTGNGGASAGRRERWRL